MANGECVEREARETRDEWRTWQPANVANGERVEREAHEREQGLHRKDVIEDNANQGASSKRTSRPVLFVLVTCALGLCAMFFLVAGATHSGLLEKSNESQTMEVSEATLTPVDYADNIEVLYQNSLGLYSGCEIVSLTMVLNSMGVDIDAYDIARNYIKYANDYSFYDFSYYENEGLNYDDDQFPPLDGRKEALDSAERDAPSENNSTTARNDATPEAEGAAADRGSFPSEESGAQAPPKSGNGKKLSITDYYIGDPYYSGMAYPPAIAKTANKILSDNDSPFVAHDITGSSFRDLLEYVCVGYPVITWVTLDYTSPLVSWTPLDQSDWLWYDNLHCVVLCGYDGETDTVTIADPLQGFIELPAEKFETVYNECGNMAVNVVPPALTRPAE